ncbi:MAG TPA: response regulator [Rhizomicrobium sp.]|jgi:PAS domain S-box-containing protein
MPVNEKANILLVDDQPAKLLSYEVMLAELGENLVKASSAREALEHLLKIDVAVILVDVCMPEQDGFELAAMIREHPRFQKTAIIFISAIHMGEGDHLRGYEMGAVDYMPVPVIPQVLRAKVKVFVELYRKTKELEQFNLELEQRVSERTFELAASTSRLMASEERRNMALSAGNMGSWEWDVLHGQCTWDTGQCQIFGLDSQACSYSAETVRARIHPDDWQNLVAVFGDVSPAHRACGAEFRIVRPSGELRWCMGTAAASFDDQGRLARISGVTADITERKRTEEHHALLAREVDHRAKNSLAVVQSIIRLTRAETVKDYITAVEGRIQALSKVHSLLAHSRWQGADLQALVCEELAAYQTERTTRIIASGPAVTVAAPVAQSLALTLHELATNATKYGALSTATGSVSLDWETDETALTLWWTEKGGPAAAIPARKGLGLQMIAANLKGHLGGNATFDWRPEGLHCKLSLPAPDAARRPSSAPGRTAHGQDGRPRVLLVEDEALVGLMAGNLLRELGFAVVGPCSTPMEALSVIEQHDLDAAILDINLGGEPVYPVADALTRRNIPFGFVTGYGGDTIEDRFARIPLLEKPVALDRLRSLLETLGTKALEDETRVRA